MAPAGLADRLSLGHMKRHCMHSPDITAFFSGIRIPMLQNLVQSPQFVQKSLWRLILYNLFLETTASNAPKGHRYRQKKRPTNNEPAAITNSAAKPTVGIAEEMIEKFPETKIPNTPHGSHEGSTGSASIHTPATIKTRIKYFKNLIMESNRSGIRTFPETTRFEKRK